MLLHYGASPTNYRDISDSNYRMGSRDSNDRDRRIDNALIGEHFRGQGSGYDAYHLANMSLIISSYKQLAIALT